MKGFLKRILVFLVPILLLSWPVDLFISHNLAKSTTLGFHEAFVWSAIYQHEISADIAIYGSSRAKKHFHPLIMEDIVHLSVYNFGMDGHSFDLQYLRHKEYLKNNRKPKFIVFSIDVFTFSSREDLFNYRQFLPFMLYNRAIYEGTHEMNGFSFYDYFFPLVRYSAHSAEIIEAIHIFLYGVEKEEESTKGFIGLENKWQNDLQDAKENIGLFRIDMIEWKIQLFKKFLDECKADDIDVVLVFAPEYVEGQKFIENHKDLIEFYTNLADEYHLTFFDYSQAAISKERKYFYNSQHLNKNGAEHFSFFFAKDFKNALLENQLCK